MSRAGHPEVRVCLLHRLRKAHGDWVSTSDLIAAAWSDRDLAEPSEAENYMRKQITRLRKMGNTVQARYGYGYRLIREAP